MKEHKEEFRKDNARALCFLLIAGFFICAAAGGIQYVLKVPLEPPMRPLEYMIYFVFALPIYYANRDFIGENGTQMLYLFESLLLGWSILLCAGDATSESDFIFFFLVLFLPLLIRDVWGHIMILTLGFAVLFLIEDASVSSAGVFAHHFLHLLICTGASLYLSNRLIRERISGMLSSSSAELRAEHDALTGIFNRRGGEQLIRGYIENEVPGAFMIIDVDDFKEVNDTYGHAAGDEVLKKVAAALQSLFRESDVVMRMGGDEFIVYAVGMADLRKVEEKLHGIIAAIHTIRPGADAEDHMTVSIGCRVNLGSYPTYDALFASADRLLYQVKLEGKDHFRFSDADYRQPK